MPVIVNHYQDSNSSKVERSDVRHAGRVLYAAKYSYHVPSDNAMIDSGEGLSYSVWDGEAIETERIPQGRPSSSHYTATADATDNVKALADRWRSALKVADHILRDVRRWQDEREEAGKIRKGAMVEVIKGRKVPKGTRWYVDHTGNGDFGPYVNLSEKPRGLGAYHRYINPDNLRVIPSEAPPMPYTEKVRMLAKAAVANLRKDTAQALADALEEDGFGGAETIHEYLRALDEINPDAPPALVADFDKAVHLRTEQASYSDNAYYSVPFTCDASLSDETVKELARNAVYDRFKPSNRAGRSYSCSLTEVDRDRRDGGTLVLMHYHSVADN